MGSGLLAIIADPACDDFGKKFRAAREAAGLNQIEVAALTGMNQAYVSRLERGIENARIETCIKFAAAVGCVYRGALRRPMRPITGLSELDISELREFTLDACAKFAAAVGCTYISELDPIDQ